MSFPRYLKYKPSGAEWLGEVPEHWGVARLRTVATLNPSKSEANVLGRDALVSFLPMECIGEDGSLDLQRERPVGELEGGYSYFRDGDVAIAKITPCFENGKGALMRGLKNQAGFGTTELIVIRPDRTKLSPEFLERLVRSRHFRQLGEAAMYGAGGQKRVPDDFVRDFRAAVPPLPEQRAIAAFLDRETAKIDALVAEQERLIELLAEKRQAVISHAVTKGLDPAAPMKPSGFEWLGDVPAHWQLVPVYARYQQALGKMLDIGKATGMHPTRYLRNIDVRWDRIDDSDLPSMDITPEEVDRFTVRNGDLLLVEGRELGRCAVWKGADNVVGFQKALHRLRPLDATENTRFFYYTMIFANRVGVFFADQTPNEIPHLTGEQLRAHRFLKPPIKEQTAIVEFLDQQAGSLAELADEAKRTVALLQERRSALISAAVTGQIDVRDAVPESAA